MPPVSLRPLFLTIGAGFVLPYLAFPRSWVPRPGAWTANIKTFGGVCMLGYGAWLIDARLVALVVLATGVCLTVHGAWRWGLSCQTLAIALLCMTLAGKQHTEDFSKASLEDYREQGRVVLLEFSSRFCSTCLINERTISSWAVQNYIREYDVVVMKAMMPNGSQLLQSMGYTSVPVMAIFPGSREPIVLSDVVTKSQVIRVLRDAHHLTVAAVNDR